MRLRDDHEEFLYEFRQRYEEMLTYQNELWDIAMANKYENPMVSIKAIDSLHSITNDIARIIDVIPYVTGGGNSTRSTQHLHPRVKQDAELIV